MRIEQFLSENDCILERLSNNNSDNKVLLESILGMVQEVTIYDFPKLKKYRDYSFKPSSGDNQQIAWQTFKKLQNQMEQWPDDIQSALLSIATLNWNGYIREQAFKRLATYRRRIFNLPFMLNGCLDPVIQVSKSADDAVSTLNFYLAKSLPEQLLMLDKVTEQAWFPKKLRCMFCIPYLRFANLDERYDYLASLQQDSEKENVLWKRFSNTWNLSAEFKKFDHVGLFCLGQNSKIFRIFCESFIYMPLELLPDHAQVILRLPSFYIKLFLRSAIGQIGYMETPNVYWDFFISCLLHNNSEINRLASIVLLHKNFNEKTFIEFYRKAFRDEDIKPAVIKGLGLFGDATDITNIINLLETPRIKIKEACLIALYRLHYPFVQEILIKFLNNPSNRLKKVARNILCSIENNPS